MSYKLVMLDVDGTLLSEEKNVTPRVRAAIRRVQEMGVIIGLCTGRLAVTCQKLSEDLHLDSYGVYYNGALIQNLLTGEILQKHILSREIGEHIVRFAREHKIYLEVHTEQSYLYELEHSYSDFQHETLGIAPIYSDILEAVRKHDVLKFQFATESAEDLERLEQFQNRNHHFELSPGRVPGHPITFVNVIPAGISKGSGIREIAGKLGIPLEQVIAVGDSRGDLEAIQTAGLGVAMGNSEEILKQHADYVTASVWEDGVAQVLEHFIIEK